MRLFRPSLIPESPLNLDVPEVTATKPLWLLEISKVDGDTDIHEKDDPIAVVISSVLVNVTDPRCVD